MERAKYLRRHQTDAEAKLWSRLRGNQQGVKFRRQHPIDGYIADFACIEHRLIVELDGGQHLEQRGYDARRARALQSCGFRVLRFWNDDALLRMDDVVNAIHRVLAAAPPPHPDPLPRRCRRRGSHSATTPSPPTATSLGERVGVRGRSSVTARNPGPGDDR